MRASCLWILTVAAALLPPTAARADFAPIPFGERITGAAVIAVGRIERLRPRDYDLRVESALAGAGAEAGRVLSVTRFSDWTCAARPRPYAEGERVLVFLEKSDGAWASMGAGCEGEVLLHEGGAEIRFPPVPGSAERYREAEVVEAVAAYRAIHRKPGTPGSLEAWHRLLLHRSPLVVATAADALVHPGSLRDAPGFGPKLGGAYFHLLRHGAPAPRAVVARHPDWFFGGEALSPVKARLLDEESPAAALALASLEPASPPRFRRLLDALARDAVLRPEAGAPVRRALLSRMAFYAWPRESRLTLADVAAEARALLEAEGDAEALRRILHWMAETFGEDSIPWTGDPGACRRRWLERLDRLPAGGAPPAAPAAPPPPVGAASVAPPEGRSDDAPDHRAPAVAWILDALRRAAVAREKGDAATERVEIRLALGAVFGDVESRAAAAGADLAAARARLEDR
jgi:hypothetical protein